MCRPCTNRDRTCTSFGECSECKARGSQCVYYKCHRGRNCQMKGCTSYHPGQWKGREQGDWGVKEAGSKEGGGKEGGGFFKKFGTGK